LVEDTGGVDAARGDAGDARGRDAEDIGVGDGLGGESGGDDIADAAADAGGGAAVGLEGAGVVVGLDLDVDGVVFVEGDDARVVDEDGEASRPASSGPRGRASPARLEHRTADGVHLGDGVGQQLSRGALERVRVGVRVEMVDLDEADGPRFLEAGLAKLGADVLADGVAEPGRVAISMVWITDGPPLAGNAARSCRERVWG
jgi:hypothetical protein